MRPVKKLKLFLRQRHDFLFVCYAGVTPLEIVKKKKSKGQSDSWRDILGHQVRGGLFKEIWGCGRDWLIFRVNLPGTSGWLSRTDFCTPSCRNQSKQKKVNSRGVGWWELKERDWQRPSSLQPTDFLSGSTFPEHQFAPNPNRVD